MSDYISKWDACPYGVKRRSEGSPGGTGLCLSRARRTVWNIFSAFILITVCTKSDFERESPACPERKDPGTGAPDVYD